MSFRYRRAGAHLPPHRYVPPLPASLKPHHPSVPTARDVQKAIEEALCDWSKKHQRALPCSLSKAPGEDLCQPHLDSERGNVDHETHDLFDYEDQR